MREWWDVIRGFTDPKRRLPRVTANQLREVFCGRLNPAKVMPAHFDADLKHLRDLMSDAIPTLTRDKTRELFFSRPFDIADMEKIKRKLGERSSKSARGIDAISYKKIVSIPNEALVKLFNFCITNRDAPQDWFTTLLIGILKLGKLDVDPESYRLIGLECCLLKVLTLLIDMRIREWAEAYKILPDSQNGFREKYRTHNNSFVVRCAIDKARAEGKNLHVAFVDLTNAFPSTDLPTLWIKLFNAGVAGPLFDWLRMLYARMSYVVKQGSTLTESFKSLIGVLTGDTASPILWNIYFTDLTEVFPPDPDDICLAGRAMSHVEQADDVALFSTSIEGLQRKLNLFFGWCRVNFMVISALKTQWMIFGELPRYLPLMFVDTTPIELVDHYKYVGITFTSIERNIFLRHYHIKASKARNVANATFASESMIGSLPPYEGLRLYMARVDPHLIFGCEVALDVDNDLLEGLKSIQHEFIRRLLGIHERSILAILFTETGVIPLRFRRLTLALGYLLYVTQLPRSHFAHTAYLDSVALANTGSPSWTSDLAILLRSLPHPVDFPEGDLSSEVIGELLKAVHASCETSLRQAVENSWGRLPLLRDRLERNTDGEFVPTTSKFRQYLRIPVPAHRKALTRLFLSAHRLGVELLRYGVRYQPRTPREWRLCRFCQREVETECHALMSCDGSAALISLRAPFFHDLRGMLPRRQMESADEFLLRIAQSRNFDVVQRFAKFVFNVFEVYGLREVYKPAPYLYMRIE